MSMCDIKENCQQVMLTSGINRLSVSLFSSLFTNNFIPLHTDLYLFLHKFNIGSHLSLCVLTAYAILFQLLLMLNHNTS